MAATLASIIVKLQDRNLVLPEHAMADIEPLTGLIVELHSEKWILGHKHWRNMRIPVVSFENLAGGSLKKHSEYAQIAILNRSLPDQELAFWGLLVQGVPETMTLTDADVVQVDEPLGEADLMAVEVKGQRACIPDLGMIEARLNEHLAV